MQPSQSRPNENKVRVLIADESPTARQRLREEIQKASWVEIIAEAGNGHDAMALFFRLKPDVVVLSVSIGYQAGFEVLRRIRHASIDSTTILTSRQSNPFVTETGLLLGASAVCCVTERPSELLRLLHQYAGNKAPKIRARSRDS
jgi:chemotaxis response regulator CheB